MSQQREWQKEQIRQGRCPQCGKKATRHYRCEECNRKHVERMRAQRAKAKGGP